MNVDFSSMARSPTVPRAVFELGRGAMMEQSKQRAGKMITVSQDWKG